MIFYRYMVFLFRLVFVGLSMALLSPVIALIMVVDDE